MLDSHQILRKVLNTNKRSHYGASIAQRLRNKLGIFSFQEIFSFHVQPFIDMDVVLMPCALELVTRFEATDNGRDYHDLCSGNFGAIYCLVISCHLPELFSFPSPEPNTRQLEDRIAVLEIENIGQKQENEQLPLSNKELRAANSALPNKRAK